MKILIVNRFFGGAQIPTGRMAEDVAHLLVERGHEVTALASTGTYQGAEKRRGDESRVSGGERKAAAHRSEDGVQRTESGGGKRGEFRVEEVRVPKWMSRALAWLWFTWQVRKRIPRLHWDVCVLMTDPPLLPLLRARLKDQKTKRPKDGGAKARGQDTGNRGQSEVSAFARSDSGVASKRHVAVWLMDLYPEALAASGRITNENPLYKWYFNKRQRALSAADLLICLGEAQRALVGAGRIQHTAYGIEQTRIAVVPPWDDRGNISLATDESLRNLALYAGNLGEAHCFEEILAAAPYLPGDWTIRFAARGAKLAALKASTSELKRPKDKETNRLGATVDITGYASEEETPGLLASARVHLITMSPDWEGIVVPSKLYGCIRTGRPVLFIGPANADTAREIRANDWGKVLSPGASGEEVAAAILELAARPTRAVQLQQGAAQVAGELIRLAEGDG